MSMQNFLKDEVINKRSQDLQKYYRLNGAIYIVKIDKFLKQKSVFLDKNIFAFEMSQEKSIDIDTFLDFKIANALLAI
jgi:CMP-N-acetylneuraminic acid synthetase